MFYVTVVRVCSTKVSSSDLLSGVNNGVKVWWTPLCWSRVVTLLYTTPPNYCREEFRRHSQQLVLKITIFLKKHNRQSTKQKSKERKRRETNKPKERTLWNFALMLDAVVVSRLRIRSRRSPSSDRAQPRRFVVFVSSLEELSSDSVHGLPCGNILLRQAARTLPLLAIDSVGLTSLCGRRGPTLTRLFLFVHLCLSPRRGPLDPAEYSMQPWTGHYPGPPPQGYSQSQSYHNNNHQPGPSYTSYPPGQPYTRPGDPRVVDSGYYSHQR